MDRAHVSGLVVVDDGWPVGLFTQREALHVKDLPRDTPVEAAMSSALLCLSPNVRVFRAAQQAATLGVRRIIAVDDSKPVGILSGLDFARVAA